ncbi:cytochrome P450 [Aspergillus affinis]|uniref:cytochrome P450 n=1 Tax=Aspergillus affinis TaxID=1070780 RepID=UPI0022FF09FD|nr:cytochrome P450 [Aspergillus affinis]KAI9043916.1 cytochrome P450 [Aspergillus affinis]
MRSLSVIISNGATVLAEPWGPLQTLNPYTSLAFHALVILSLSGLAGILYSKIRERIAFHSAQINHGCQKPPSYPHKGWISLDLVRERQISSDEGHLTAHYDYWFNRLGHTREETLAGQRLINPIDITNARAVFHADMNTLGRAGGFHRKDLLGPGIFSSDGPRWKFSRNMINSLFSKAEVRSTTMLKRHVDRLIAQIPRDSNTIDVQPLLKKMNFDASAEFIFGKSTDSLLPETPYSNGNLIEAFNYASAGSLKRRKAGLLAFRCSLDRRYTRDVAWVHTFVDQEVRRVLNQPSDADESKPNRWNYMTTPPEFVPFGGGRRICPAYHQVYLQSAYIFIRLTKEFEDIENRDPVLEYIELDRNLTESRNGVKIGLTVAKA